MHFDSTDEAQAATDKVFQAAAAKGFMTPTMCPRFLVTNTQAGDLAIAFGGAGYYPTDQANEDLGYEAVASLHATVVLPQSQATALVQALTNALAALGAPPEGDVNG